MESYIERNRGLNRDLEVGLKFAIFKSRREDRIVPVEGMPLLIKDGRLPVSAADVLSRQTVRQGSPIYAWSYNNFFTSDAIAYGVDGDCKIVLDAPQLKELNPKSKINKGALVLEEGVWENLEGDKVLYLTSDEVKECNKKGYFPREGGTNYIFAPDNNVAGKVWKFLYRDGFAAGTHANHVTGKLHHPGIAEDRFLEKHRIMHLLFDTEKYSTPVMRSVVVSSIHEKSAIRLNKDLNEKSTLVGKLPDGKNVSLDEVLAIALKHVPAERQEEFRSSLQLLYGN